MRYMILDLETETHHRYKRKANPFLKENYIVARGWKVQGDLRCSCAFYDNVASVEQIDIPDDADVLVAHNAKFELLYELRFSYESLQRFFKRGGRIWCTQLAEYLLNGQHRKYHMASLNDTAVTYGGKVKIDGIKELWDAGMLTSEINRDLLTDYLIGTKEEGRNGGDIGNTEIVYLGQLKAAKDLGMMEAIKVRMDSLCATSDMEFRGLKIDVERARADLKKRTAELKAAEVELASHITFIPKEVQFNWASRIHVSCLIFGGTIKYEKQTTYIDPDTGELARLKATVRWPLFDGEPVDPRECEPRDVDTYQPGDQLVRRVLVTEREPEHKPHGWRPKSQEVVYYQDTFLSGKKAGEPKFKSVPVPGELKVKYQDFLYDLPGVTAPDPSWKGALTDGRDKPVYSTASEVIDIITKRDIPFLKALGKKSGLDKEIGTYYVKIDDKGVATGMLTCVQVDDHFVHHKLNHTSTVTSRLSSSEPNMQNLTRADFDTDTQTYKSEIKAMFISRFPDGVMGELDYSQLEVVVQGLLSNDTNLIRDLIGKIDFHCKRVALKNSVSYEFALMACKDEDFAEYPKWKNERTKCKSFSFQRAYGAGAALIAEETGMAVEEVKDMIVKEDEEYPGVPKFNAAVEREVNATAEPFKDGERGWRVFRAGTYQAPTGTMYCFRSYDAQDWQRQRGIMDSFSPTEMKNYPVQGTGGEIVQMVSGVLWRWFVKNDFFGGRAFLVNTVHDCFWVDMHPDVVDIVMSGMLKIMQSVPQFMKLFYGMDCPVPFPADAEVGKNMLELHHWKPTVQGEIA